VFTKVSSVGVGRSFEVIKGAHYLQTCPLQAERKAASSAEEIDDGWRKAPVTTLHGSTDCAFSTTVRTRIQGKQTPFATAR
jgi:hypothetical protein